MAEMALYGISLIFGVLSYLLVRPVAGFLAGISIKVEQWGEKECWRRNF